MPEFQLDTDGVVTMHDPAFAYVAFRDLDDLTQGYITAAFWTEGADDDEGELSGKGYSDLAPETLASMIDDCRVFQATPAWRDWIIARDDLGQSDEQGGHDLWLTRNGHGAGFWDGDWPEPHGKALDEAARWFGSVDLYVGDDGLVYGG